MLLTMFSGLKTTAPLNMKTKTLVQTTTLIFAFAIACVAQDNPSSVQDNTALDAAMKPASETATQPVAEPVTELAAQPAAEPVAETAAETAVEPAAEPGAAPAAEAAAQPAAEPAVEATPVSPAPAASAASDASAQTEAPVASNIIPLIQFVDAPLTAVIENLARQAGMNYILDPKINFGQPGPDGRVIPQPSISIRWENLTAQQALGALLNNYDLQLIENPKTKIARIAPKDPAAPDPLVTKVIQLKFANPSNIVEAVQSSFSDKRSKVVTDIRTSQLVVVATEKELVSVDELVNRLDTITRQVLIEARLIETSLNPKTAKGIDWSGTLANQTVRWGNGVPYTEEPTGLSYKEDTATGTYVPVPGNPGLLSRVLDPSLPMLQASTAGGFNPETFFLNADGVTAVLSFLNTDSDAKVIATPRAVTLDNETANLAVTEARPIFKTTAGTQGSPGGSEVLYTNLGTILQVTPRISANNYVNLKVVPEVSSWVKTVRKTVSGQVNEADVFAFRKIETQVLIPSGNTLVLGGLISDSSTKGYTKVPVLGDIPGLGLAFRKESKERQQKNLLIFITPTIVGDEDFQPTSTDFLKTTIPTSDDKPWSWWDSGKPAVDWSKPEESHTYKN